MRKRVRLCQFRRMRRPRRPLHAALVVAREVRRVRGMRPVVDRVRERLSHVLDQRDKLVAVEPPRAVVVCERRFEGAQDAAQPSRGLVREALARFDGVCQGAR